METHRAAGRGAVALRQVRPSFDTTMRASAVRQAKPTGGLEPGDHGRPVAALKDALRGAGYLVDTDSDRYTSATRDAVMAFQKVNGLPRTGNASPRTIEALRTPVQPPLVGGPETRLEVDKSTQTGVFLRGGRIEYIVNASTGQPRVYDGKYRETPAGAYEVAWKVNGWRESDLGLLYKPSYFHDGLAVHGAAKVPAYPASHGCVRVPMWAADKVFRDLSLGTPIIIHNGASGMQSR